MVSVDVKHHVYFLCMARTARSGLSLWMFSALHCRVPARTLRLSSALHGRVPARTLRLSSALHGRVPARTLLRSASDTLSLQIPRTKLSTVGSRAFSVSGPSTWNVLQFPFISDRNPLRTPSSQSSKQFFFQYYRPAMFSVPCCCLHQSQVSLLPVLSCLN